MSKEKTDIVRLPKPTNDTQRVIKQIVDAVTQELNSFDWPWDVLAEKAGVSYGTIQRFRYREYRDSPLLSTVLKIAKAVGLEVRVSKRKRVTIRRAG